MIVVGDVEDQAESALGGVVLGGFDQRAADPASTRGRRDEEPGDDREPLDRDGHSFAPLSARPGLIGPVKREMTVERTGGLADPGGESGVSREPACRFLRPADRIAVGDV